MIRRLKLAIENMFVNTPNADCLVVMPPKTHPKDKSKVIPQKIAVNRDHLEALAQSVCRFSKGHGGLAYSNAKTMTRAQRGAVDFCLTRFVSMTLVSRWPETLLQILAEHRPEAALIFCETRQDCDDVADFLAEHGAPALPLHGGLEQRDRDDVLLQFTQGSIRLLVATNVAARGLDIPSLPAVIVTELSRDPESHLHRIGRTGRAGETGLALSIVAGATEQARLAAIEAFTGHALPRGGALPNAKSVAFLAPLYRTLMVFSGRKDKLRKGDILGALIKDGQIPAEAIGRIDLSAKTCAIAIRRSHAQQALTFLHAARVKKKRVRAILLGAE